MPDPLKLVQSHRELVDALITMMGALDAAREQEGLRQIEREWSEASIAAWLRELALTGWRITAKTGRTRP